MLVSHAVLTPTGFDQNVSRSPTTTLVSWNQELSTKAREEISNNHSQYM
jgi:hypothetical protein